MRKISAAVIDFGNQQIGLQLRDNRPSVECAGQISFFGGNFENNEDAISALTREVYEELRLSSKDYNIKPVEVFDYIDGNGKEAIIHFYIISNIDFKKLRIKEGHLCITNIENGIGEIDLIDSLKAPLEKAIKIIKKD